MHKTDMYCTQPHNYYSRRGKEIKQLQHMINEMQSACLQYCIFVNWQTLGEKSTLNLKIHGSYEQKTANYNTKGRK
jgi:hypothetical protein